MFKLIPQEVLEVDLVDTAVKKIAEPLLGCGVRCLPEKTYLTIPITKTHGGVEG